MFYQKRRTGSWYVSVVVWNLLVGIAVFECGAIAGEGQSTAAKTTASPVGTSGPQGPSTAFSIETEMLTYRALESNSEAIACDVSGFLYHSPADFKTASAGGVCNVKAGSRAVTVLIASPDQTAFADFNVWRTDMATMDRLLDKAEGFNCPAGNHRAGVSAVSSLLSMSPAGPPLALAQSVFALLNKTEEVSAVGGTIQDRAFIDGLARELRALQVRVIVPATYTPYSLSQIDEKSSPFMNQLDTLMLAEGCLKQLKTPPPPFNQSDIDNTVAEIDGFRKLLGDDPPSVTKGQSYSAGATPSTAGTPGTSGPTSSGLGQQKQSPGSGNGSTVVTNELATAPSSHMVSLLAGDGLAQALGIGPDGKGPDSSGLPHILLVKALESGGSVSRTSNILGTKIRYSGGSVGTYALFNVNGDLECSGNVFEYAGSIPSKNFDKALRSYSPAPSNQVLFLRGGCGATVR